MKRNSKDIFIEKARKVHQGENLDYSKVEYINNRTPVCIIDHDLDENSIEYGEFWQTPSNHLKGQKHPKKRNKRIQNSKKGDFEELIKKFDAVHQDENLDYSKSEYVNMHTPILVVDHTINENGDEYGEYYVIPSHHIKGGKSARRRQCEMSDEFIKRSRKIHNGKYDYSKVNYEKYDKPVCIICPEHGEFWQTPSHHLNGCGCPKCNGGYKSNTLEFIEKAKLVHGDKYDYSETRYCGNKIPVKIICPDHGEFWQTPDKHLIGHGCQMCGSTISKAEVNVCDIVKEIVGKDNVIEQDRKVLNGRELDVYVPSKKVAFEYDGLIWHSEKFGKGRQYHISKTNECKEMGIRLIHIFEDEYLEHKDIVIKKIHHILGDDANLPIIGARKCEIKEITKNEAKVFLNEFHMQGFGSGTEYYGAFYNDRLLAVMVFLEERKCEWNLTRFATDINCRIPGIASKLFKFFVKKHNDIVSIKSFLDRRWNIEGNTLYEKLGFKLDGINEPDYYYVNGVKRYHKFGFRKHILHKKYGLPLTMTESEMTAQLGYYKIWNCGLAKYIWKPES